MKTGGKKRKKTRALFLKKAKEKKKTIKDVGERASLARVRGRLCPCRQHYRVQRRHGDAPSAAAAKKQQAVRGGESSSGGDRSRRSEWRRGLRQPGGFSRQAISSRPSSLPVRLFIRVSRGLLHRRRVLPLSFDLALRVEVRETKKRETQVSVGRLRAREPSRLMRSLLLINLDLNLETKKISLSLSSHSHGRLLSPLSAARLATFSLFFLFVFVPWVLLRVPLSVARAEAYAPLADGGGGRGIPRSTVVECLRLIKIDDVAFWVSVGLTAAALFAAGVLRFVVRRRHGIEGGCGSCCGGGRGRDRENATTANAKCSGGDETSTTASSSSLSSFFTLAPLLLSDLLAWLLCPACALCQEARSAAAWEREKRAVDAVRARVANGGGGEEEGEQEEALLLLEAPPVPRAFDRGSEV